MNKNYSIGIIFKLINCFMFPVLSLVMITSVATIPIMQVLFCQVFLGAMISFAYLIVIKQPISLKMPKKDLYLYLARALVNFIAVLLWLYAIQTIGINEATALGYTGPLWVFIMAQYLVGEKFSYKIFILILTNMIGMMIIINPNLEQLHWLGIGAALLSILLWSLYEIICKKQAATQHYMLQTFYFMSISSVVMAPFAWQDWQPVSSLDISMLSLIALLAVTNITVLFIAYKFAPITLLAPFSYSRLVFTTCLTNWLYHIDPTLGLFIGSAIIFVANGYFLYKVKSEPTAAT